MKFFKDQKDKKDVEVKSEKKEVKNSKNISNKPKKVKKVVEPKKVSKTTQADLSWVLESTRITEKGAISAGDKVYIFNVSPRANKLQIKEAIEKRYKVSPIKVNIATIKSKTKVRRGVKGKTAGGKKAYVYLNKKDSIEFV